MGLSDNPISIDPEGVADAPRSSFLVIIAVVTAILGLFAIVAPFFAFFCLISIVCGLFVVAFAKRWDLSSLSVRVASCCIYTGLFCGLSGVAYMSTRNWIIQKKASEVAATYVHALANGDRATAIKMSGLPPMVADADLDSEKTSREQKAVRSFLEDPAIQEVIKIGNKADWQSTGLKAKFRTGIVLELTVGFIDKNSTNPRPILVTTKMVPPTKNSVESRTQWFIDSIFLAPL